MNSRTLIIAAVAVALIGAVFAFALLQKGGRQKIDQRQKELEQDLGRVTEPMTSSLSRRPPTLDYERLTTKERPPVITELITGCSLLPRENE
jgi:hypothetical protein